MNRIKLLLIILLTVIILFATIIAMHYIMSNYNFDSDFVIGLLGAIVGGMFSLVSVWIANELQNIKNKFNELPIKIRRISKLRDKIWKLKEAIGQNEYRIQELTEGILEIGSLIDGNVYSKCVSIRDKLLVYYYKNIDCRGTNNIGDYIITPSDEYIQVKQELYEILINEHNLLLKYEEKLTKRYQ
jgi:hypothetical protein